MTHPSVLSLPHPPLAFSMVFPLEVEVRASILDFAPEEWDALVSRDEPQLRHDVLLASQKSGMFTNPRYAAVRRGGLLAGVAVMCDSDIDLLTLAAPKLKNVAERIRRGPLKRLGILRAQTCGPVITNCRANIALSAELGEDVRREVAAQLLKAVDNSKGAGLRVFFELDDKANANFGPALEQHGYVEAASLPGTRLPIVWSNFEEYVGSMRKTYRRAVRDDQAKAHSLDIEILSDFAALADEVHQLYSNVLERAVSTFQTLSADFFREFAQCQDSRLVTARLKETGQLVGIELLLIGDNMVQDLYTGVDYRFNAEHNIYFNLSYPAIAMACREGFRFVSTGQTSYKFKSRLGIEPFKLSVYLKHRNSLANAILHRIHPLICPQTAAVEHRVFKSEAQHVNTAPKAKQ